MPSAQIAKPTIVLVHGAFTDASGWEHVIPILQHDGYNVVAVQNNMTSFEDDVATTKRLIDAQKGPVVVVGHSYGGAVVTTAAVGNSNIKALVYIAAFAPDQGEVIGPLTERYPSKLNTALVPDTAGFLFVDRAKFNETIAKDVPERETEVMAATQRPVAASVFDHKFSEPAWKSIPSWYMITTEDNAINPELERITAKKIGATTVEVKSSHVPFISHPKQVADLIERAATATTK